MIYTTIGLVLINPVRCSQNPDSCFTCENLTRFFFIFFSSSGHFVLRSGTCRSHVQLLYTRLILISPVKFGWNPASSLISESKASLMWTDGRSFLFFQVLSYLYCSFLLFPCELTIVSLWAIIYGVNSICSCEPLVSSYTPNVCADRQTDGWWKKNKIFPEILWNIMMI